MKSQKDQNQETSNLKIVNAAREQQTPSFTFTFSLLLMKLNPVSTRKKCSHLEFLTSFLTSHYFIDTRTMFIQVP